MAEPTTKEPKIVDIENEKLERLTEDSGYETPEDLVRACIFDSVSPGICMNDDCDYNIDVEPDSLDGWCELCETQSVQSATMLFLAYDP